jgi:hypothetical protein
MQSSGAAAARMRSLGCLKPWLFGARAGGYFVREIDFEDPSCTREYERWTIAFWEGD